MSMFLFYDAWRREFESNSNIDLIPNLILGIAMLESYRSLVDSPVFIGTEDYVNSITSRATTLFIRYGLTYTPWRRNAKTNITDVILGSEKGLAYLSYRFPNVCDKVDIVSVEFLEKGLSKEKIDRCIKLLESLLREELAKK